MRLRLLFCTTVLSLQEFKVSYSAEKPTKNARRASHVLLLSKTTNKRRRLRDRLQICNSQTMTFSCLQTRTAFHRL